MFQVFTVLLSLCSFETVSVRIAIEELWVVRKAWMFMIRVSCRLQTPPAAGDGLRDPCLNCTERLGDRDVHPETCPDMRQFSTRNRSQSIVRMLSISQMQKCGLFQRTEPFEGIRWKTDSNFAVMTVVFVVVWLGLESQLAQHHKASCHR